MKKVLWFVFALVLGVGVTMVAQADAMMCDNMKGMGGGMAGMDMGMHQMDMGMHEGPLMKHIMALGLDEKQIEAVQAIHFRWKKEAVRKKADMAVAGMELKEILSKDPVDVKAAEQKIRQIEALKADMHIAHLKAHEEVKSKLTPEQRKKLHSPMHMGPMGMGMGMGMRHGMGMGMGHRMGMPSMNCMGDCMMGGCMDDDDDDDGPAPGQAPPAPPAPPKHH